MNEGTVQVLESELDGPDLTIMGDRASINGFVVVLALLTCLFIVALPMLGSLALAAAVLGVFAGGGLAALYVLSRV